MALSEKAYEALERAVGAENATREEAMLDSYSWQPFLNMSTELWVKRPAAVVLPSCTEEVRKVVQACNEHGMKFKALSTGWGAHNSATYDDVVIVDLRRMNRILEIDVNNMYAVVEPYVCGGELQAEAWKHGLNTHIVGAGPHGSVLAGATSMHGCGNDSIYMSTSSRNLLGVEWVLPDGEILRLGTPGSGSEWFCGDGPGPSLRGIVRGTSGAFGGFGIFTKAAVKLFNWPGPAHVESKGTILDSTAELPDCCSFFSCSFPTEKDYLDAAYMLGEAEIGYLFVRMVTSEFVMLLMPRLFPRILKRKNIMDFLNRVMANSFMLMMVSDSESEKEYQQRMLDEIMRSCNGNSLNVGNIPFAKRLMGVNLLRCTIFATVFRSGNLFATNLDGNEISDSQLDWSHKMENIHSEYINNGALIDNGGECPYIIEYENNLFGHCETIYLYDQRNSRHLESLHPLVFDTALSAIEQCNVPLAAFDPVTRKLMSPLACDFNKWQKAFSEAFDPKGVSDTGFYTDECDPDWSRIRPDRIEKLKKLVSKYGGSLPDTLDYS